MGAALKAIQQRATRRLPIRVEVEYSTTEDFLLDYTANVSLGGVFIVTDTPLSHNISDALFAWHGWRAVDGREASVPRSAHGHGWLAQAVVWRTGREGDER